MEGEIIDLGLLQLVSAYIFVLILLGIVKLKKIPREKDHLSYKTFFNEKNQLKTID